jgi:cyclohexanone monooxygenase
MGLSLRAFEKGTDVGGTWYWNRYPGASSDSESWVYSYSFSPELLHAWKWSRRFPGHAEIRSYLQFVADKLDLRRAYDFETTVIGATFDPRSARWTVETNRGDSIKSAFLITAVGCLSAAQMPKIPGVDAFRGESYHTGEWPQTEVDFSGKRVGVIGTGSSAIQAIPIIAEQAAHLTVFQRTPQFSVPSRNRDLSADEQRRLQRDIEQIRETCKWTFIGQPYDFRPVGALEVDAAARRKQYEADWQTGGFSWMFGSYNDLLLNAEANATAAEFVREKIRGIVRDPDVARKLIPEGYPIATKRLPLDANYFETYNRNNVDLVDLRETPIVEIVPEGIRTADRTHPLDVIVFATGFDALTGPLTRLNVRGRNGETLGEKWSGGPRTYLGVATADFPNLFMITGPGSPSVLGNMPTSIEQHVEWISDCIAHMRDHGAVTIEPTKDAEDAWVEHVNALAAETLMPQANSWYMGANIPGKARVFMPYIGGFGTYRKLCAEVAADDYRGFVIR